MKYLQRRDERVRIGPCEIMEEKKSTAYYHGADRVKMQIAYSLGGIPMNLPWILVSSYLMFFLTDIALVPAAVVSALFLGVRAFDAINDPLIGIMSDRTKSRWGRYRPWMFVGAIMLIPTLTLLFWAHPDWSVGARTAYACVLYCFAVVFATMWDIPYGALNSCITPDPTERASFSSSRILVSSAACAVGSGVFLPLIAKMGGAAGDTVGGYVKATLIIALCTIPFTLICCGKTKEVVYPPKSQKMTPGAMVKTVVQNPPLLILLIGFFMFGFLSYGRMAVGLYYFTYVVGNAKGFSIYALVNGILSGLGSFFGVSLLLRFFKSKRDACIFGYVVQVICNGALFLIDPAKTGMTTVLAILLVGGTLNGFVTGMIYGMIPDTVEYGQWKSGVRTDGFVYAITSFMNKLGGAVGPALLGMLLATAGYIGGVEVQTESALSMINICMNLVPTILAAVAIIALTFYKLDNKLYAQIRQELDAREAEKASE